MPSILDTLYVEASTTLSQAPIDTVGSSASHLIFTNRTSSQAIFGIRLNSSNQLAFDSYNGSIWKQTLTLKTVEQEFIFESLVNSSNTTTGAVQLLGGMGIAGNLYIGGSVVINTDLTVNGTVTTINSTELSVADRVIRTNVNVDPNTPVPTYPVGIAAERGDISGVKRDRAGWTWDENTSRWRSAFLQNTYDTTYGTDLDIQVKKLVATDTITSILAATQDAVRLQGRAGGTSSYIGTLTPTTLGASRTYTLPDKDGTVAMTSDIASPSLTATYVGFGSGSNSLTGSTKITWDDTNASFKINGTGGTLPAQPTGNAGIQVGIGSGNAAVTRILADVFMGTGGGYAVFAGRAARGTVGSPSALQLGDEITNLSAWGYGATGYSAAARGYVSIFAAENWTDAVQGTRIGLFTTTPGGVVTTEKIRIWGDGGLQLGGVFTASPGIGALSVTSTVVSSNTSTGALIVSGGVGIAGALNIGGSLGLPSQTANYVFAAPNGSAGAPGFRALVAADISGLTAWATKTYPTDASGLLRNNGSGTLSWDTNTYLTANQSITLSGDVTGSGTTSISTTVGAIKNVSVPTLATGYLYYNGSAFSWAAAGGGFTNPMTALGDIIYGGAGGAATSLAGNVTTTKQFLVQTGTGTVSAAPAWGTISSSDVSGLTAWATKAYPTDASGLLRNNGSGTLSWDTNTYLTANQSITLSGDVTGSGTTSISTTVGSLKNVSIPTLATGYLYYNGSAFVWQTPSSGFTNPMSALGDIIYGGVSGAATSLAGNITTTKNFLVQTGTGTVSAAPAWGTISSSDVSGLTAWATKAYPTDASGLLRNNGSGTLSWDTNTYLTANQSITLSGDVTGSGTTSISTTVGSLKSVSIPTLATGYLYYNGSAFVWQTPSPGFTNPMTALGDTLYGGAAGAATSLAGNVTTTKNFLVQTGTGTISAAPAWGTISSSDVSGLTAWATKTYPTDASGLLRNNGSGTLSWDTNTYLTANQSITLSGDVTGSGTTSISTTVGSLKSVSIPTLATGYLYYNGSAFSWAAAGGGFTNPMSALGDIIYGGASGAATSLAGNITTTKNFLVQTGTGTVSAAPAWGTISSSDVSGLTAWATKTYPTDASGLLRNNGSGTLSWDTNTYLTANQSITLSGDATGSGTTSISTTVGSLKNVSIPTLATGYLYYNGSTFVWQTPSPGFTNPMSALGDIIYGGASGAATSLAGNVTTTKNFLVQTGTGTVSAAPAWGTISSSDVSGLTAWATKAYPTDASGLLRNNGSGTLSWDTNTYLTANQSITLSGDVTGSGTTSISTTVGSLKSVSIPTLATGYLYYNGSAFSWAAAGGGFTNPMSALGDIIYGGAAGAATSLAGNTTATKNFLVQTGTGTVSAAPAWGTISSSDVSGLTAWATKTYPTDASGLLRNNGSGTLSWDNAAYLTANQSITLSSDVTGSGTTSITATIAAKAVTLAKMADLAANSIIGNNTSGPATPIALTATQVKSLLSIASGDVSGLTAWATKTYPTDAVGVLTNNGSGTLSWAAASGQQALTQYQIAFGSASNLVTSSANLTYDGSVLLTTGVIQTSNATASTSAITGSGIFGGGIGVAGAGYFGTSVTAHDITNLGQYSQTSPAISGGLGSAAVSLSLTAGGRTGLDGSVEAIDVLVNLNRTVQFNSGALAQQRSILIQPATYSFTGASVLSDADTVVIIGPPSGGTNATITEARGLAIETRALTNVTTSYALKVTAASGATTNWAAAFAGDVRVTGGIIALAAATQDAVKLQGRAGGTSSYIGTLTPTTLGASRTYTLPDKDGTVAMTSDIASPSLTATYLGFGSGSNLLTGSTKITWDDTNASFKINGTGGTLPAQPTGNAGIQVGTGSGNAAVTRILADVFMGTGGGYAVFAGRAARGTVGSPSALQLGDEITNLSAWGYGATGYSAAARGYVSIFAAENWTDAAQGTRIGLFTTMPGGVVTSEKIRIWGDGGLQLGGSFAVSPGVGALLVTSSIASTNTTTGAAIISGGVGVAGSIYVGSDVSVAGTLIIKNVNEAVNAIGNTGAGTVTVNCLTANRVTMTVTGNATLAFSNIPAAGTAKTMVLHITNGSAFTFAFPANTRWAGGIAPVLRSSGLDIIGLTTIDGGTTWDGIPMSLDSKVP
jgi:filamentous hemagglutinin